MSQLERPEAFYLGRRYDLEEQTVLDEPVYYDSHHLTTHGVVVGMTGSGKTGLCISLLEEAALHGIPSVIVDLKGDLSNLLLNFPQMRPEDFEPWVDPDEARRHDASVPDHAAAVARKWREGLAAWGQDLERVRRLGDSADCRVYTPGSEAGLPVSVIQNFTAPEHGTDRETLNERVEATASALLGLTRISADPVQSREHILVANLLLNAWVNGRDLDLPRLINEVTTPPLRTIGTFDIDMFYPEQDRLQLALALNNLLASPSFSTWITGEPLHLQSMLYGPGGKPRQVIFYLAHLDEAQRMFFLSLLLEEVLTWTRAQHGTSGLRAIFFMDEVFGYLPPHPANPPTKRPLMTLLKQARAFGVGVLLATQNPVDLDYKALSNAGTWFVGKLQTERDKARLVEGLQGVAAEQGTLADAGYLEAAISSLGNRVFLLHDVRAGKPFVFHTRWSLSYLHGPMTREHLAEVMRPIKAHAEHHAEAAMPVAPRSCPDCHSPAPPQARFCMHCGTALAAPEPVESAAAGGPDANGVHVPPAPPAGLPVATTAVPPVLPPGLTQFFIPIAASEGSTGAVVFEPRLLGFAEVGFNDRKHKLEYRHVYRLLAEAPDAVRPEPWRNAEEIPETLTASPAEPEGIWAVVPETLNAPKKLKSLERDFTEFLHKNATLTFYHNRHLGLLSKPGEDRTAFEERCRQAAAESADAQIARPPESRSTGNGEPRQSATDGPPPAAAGKTAERNAKDAERIRKRWLQRAGDLKEVRLTPRKADIRVTHFGLAWAPFRWTEGASGPTGTPAYDRREIPPENWRTAAAGTDAVEVG